MRRILYEIASANATKQALVEIRLKEWPKADARNASSPLQFRHAQNQLGDKRSQSLAILAWILSVKSLYTVILCQIKSVEYPFLETLSNRVFL